MPVLQGLCSDTKADFIDDDDGNDDDDDDETDNGDSWELLSMINDVSITKVRSHIPTVMMIATTTNGVGVLPCSNLLDGAHRLAANRRVM